MEKITKENLMKSIVFFNNKGGVGKTTFTYHIGFALEQAGKKILFVDADPQCNLSSHLCDEQLLAKNGEPMVIVSIRRLNLLFPVLVI